MAAFREKVLYLNRESAMALSLQLEQPEKRLITIFLYEKGYSNF